VCPQSSLGHGHYRPAIGIRPAERSRDRDTLSRSGRFVGRSIPQVIWLKLWSNKLLDRVNVAPRGALDSAMFKRRTRVVGIFPNDPAIIRLIGAMLLEQHEHRSWSPGEWPLPRVWWPSRSWGHPHSAGPQHLSNAGLRPKVIEALPLQPLAAQGPIPTTHSRLDESLDKSFARIQSIMEGLRLRNGLRYFTLFTLGFRTFGPRILHQEKGCSLLRLLIFEALSRWHDRV
jgi:hypothetical protein